MKHVFLFSIGLFTLSCSNAQKPTKETIPASVKEAFAKKYPAAKVMEWEVEENGFEAEFKMKKVEMSANFDKDGAFMEEETEIKTSELPDSVKEYCTKTYPDHKLTEAAKIIDANGKLMYEAEMKKGKVHFDVLFDSSGNFISKGAPVSEESEDKD